LTVTPSCEPGSKALHHAIAAEKSIFWHISPHLAEIARHGAFRRVYRSLPDFGAARRGESGGKPGFFAVPLYQALPCSAAKERQTSPFVLPFPNPY
jgi:hypothetical protein